MPIFVKTIGKLILFQTVDDSGHLSDPKNKPLSLELPPQLEAINPPAPLQLGVNTLPRISIDSGLVSASGSGENLAFGLVHADASAKLTALSLQIFRQDEIVFMTGSACEGCGQFLPPNSVSIFILDQDAAKAIPQFLVDGNSVTAEVTVEFEMGTQRAELAGYLGVYRLLAAPAVQPG
jgi:hypothetical protein